MSQVFTATRICEEALRAIGEFPVTESAADPEKLRTALTWLDLNLAEIAGTERIFALIPATLEIPVTNGTSDYDLEATLGADMPPDGLQFPVEAWLEDGDGNRTPLEIVTKAKFEGVPRLDEQGAPCRIYIDRLAVTPQLSIFPTPSSEDTNSYTVKLDVQTYAPNVAPKGVTGARANNVETKFRQAWQRWMILQVAGDIGSGPVTKIGDSSLKILKGEAGLARTRLLAFENREHDTEPPVCEPWGM